jgi:hypothetical protein
MPKGRVDDFFINEHDKKLFDQLWPAMVKWVEDGARPFPNGEFRQIKTYKDTLSRVQKLIQDRGAAK